MTDTLAKWSASAGGYTSDSRNLRDGTIFVALKGENSDGHDFVLNLLESTRVKGFVVSRAFYDKNSKTLTLKRPASDFFPVENTHATHRELARIFRDRFRGTVVAVGGSSGKTSCKEFLSQILSSMEKRCVATYKSQNGELGIPKTLESLTSDVDIAVIEIGIDGPGDMIRHVEIVQPDIAILTSIGEEHLNLLKNIDGVLAEEKILFDKTIERGGRCFAPQSDAWLSRLPKVELVPDAPELVDPAFVSNLSGIFPKRNAALAAQVCRTLFPQEKEKIALALQKLEIPDGRGRVVERGKRIWVEDHYNSNPSSLRASLQQAVLLKQKNGKELTLVLGDMLDLGDLATGLHQSIVSSIKAANPARVVLIGPLMSALAPALKNIGCMLEVYPDSAAAAQSTHFSDWGRTITVFKGSRGMALEKTLKAFQNSEAS